MSRKSSTSSPDPVKEHEMDLSPEKVVSSSEQVIPTSEQVAPSAEKVVPSAEQAVPSAEHVVPSAEQVVPSPENGVLSSEKAVPPPYEESQTPKVTRNYSAVMLMIILFFFLLCLIPIKNVNGGESGAILDTGLSWTTYFSLY